MPKLSMFLLGAVISAPLAACGDNGGGTPVDVPTDSLPDTVTDSTDSPGDTPEDTTVDTGTNYSTCLESCTVPDDCCLPGGRPCGQYPNKWLCDTVCLMAGCADHAECAAWATAVGLADAANYRCAPAHLYWSASYCVPGCSSPADCCPTGSDCTSYPRRRLCVDGACKVDGCVGDTECQTWATGQGLPDPTTFVCRTLEFSDKALCVRPCTTTTDCCPTGCDPFPDHGECLGGYCVATCTENAECVSWAGSQMLPDAANYVCHGF